MKNKKCLSIEALGKISNQEVDQILLTLWDIGIEEVDGPKSILLGQKLILAKRVLGIPLSNELTSLKYWESVFSIDETQLRDLLYYLKVPMSKKARKLPTGAIKKLKAEIIRRKSIYQTTLIKAAPLIAEEISTDVLKWKVIGHREDYISLVSLEEVLQIHFALVDDFVTHEDPIDPAGPRNSDILGSAIFRQSTSIGTELKYPTIEMTGAALLHSLVHNHPFHNGNKRTALVSLLVFLDKNQSMLVCREDELFKFVLNVAQHRIIREKYVDLSDREVLHIAEWIKDNSRAIEMGERPLSFRKLKQILAKYNCDIFHSGGGTNIKITRSRPGKRFFERKRILTTNISCNNDGREVQRRTINKIRNELELNEENGIDSAGFYEDSASPVDEFILKYRKTLLRLSKV